MKELMKEEVSNENGEQVEAQDEATYLLLSGDEDLLQKFLFNRGKH